MYVLVDFSHTCSSTENKQPSNWRYSPFCACCWIGMSQWRLQELSVRHRAVFKGGRLRVQHPPPEMLKRKFFGDVKKHAQGNASADALYVCTILWCQEKPSGIYKMQETALPPELKSWLRPWGGMGKGGIGPPTFWLLPPPIHIVLHCDINLVG